MSSNTALLAGGEQRRRLAHLSLLLLGLGADPGSSERRLRAEGLPDGAVSPGAGGVAGVGAVRLHSLRMASRFSSCSLYFSRRRVCAHRRAEGREMMWPALEGASRGVSLEKEG